MHHGGIHKRKEENTCEMVKRKEVKIMDPRQPELSKSDEIMLILAERLEEEATNMTTTELSLASIAYFQYLQLKKRAD